MGEIERGDKMFKFEIQWRANNRASFEKLIDFSGTIQELEMLLNLLREKHAHPVQFSAIATGNYNEVISARKARELYRAKDETVVESKKPSDKKLGSKQGDEIRQFFSRKEKAHNLKYARVCH